MKDVSKLAGVSVITVSRVINNPEKVKESTRKKVQEVMEQLDFQPNYAARALVTNRTRTVHLWYPRLVNSSDPFMMKLVAGISEELSNHYYSFLFRKDWDFPYKCDGVIAMGLENGEDKRLKEKIDVPCVLFGRSPEFHWINVDDVKGARKIVEFIISQGHTKIGMIAVDVNAPFADERFEGYRQALESNGIPFNQEYIRYATPTERDGFEKSTELLSSTDITALFCMNDILALGAIQAARSLRKQVPEDISIGGYDGVWLDQLTEPSLTTVRLPVYEIGKELAKLIIEIIENPQKQRENRLFDPELIVRNSIIQIRKQP